MNIGEIEKVWEIEPQPAEEPLTVPEPDEAPKRECEPSPATDAPIPTR